MQIARVVNAKQTYFTHISHLLGFHREINDELPKNMRLAYDELILEF